MQDRLIKNHRDTAFVGVLKWYLMQQCLVGDRPTTRTAEHVFGDQFDPLIGQLFVVEDQIAKREIIQPGASQ